MRNLAGLLIGFGIGQGLVFLAMTILMLQGNRDFVGQIGLGIALVTVAFQAVDWGMLVTITRAVSSQQLSVGSKSSGYTESMVVRLGVAVAISLVIAPFWLGRSHFDDARGAIGMICGAVPALYLHALNLQGYMDGSGRSGMSGLLASFPWIFLAGFMLVVDGRGDLEQLGYGAGLAFSVGVLVSISLQYLVCSRLGILPKLAPLKKILLKQIFKEGAGNFLGWLPGQIMGRAQILVAGWLLGPPAMGTVVYIRQIVNSSNQLTYFVRRIEFPAVVMALRDSLSKSAAIVGALERQRLGLALGAVLSAVMIGASLLASLFDFGPITSTLRMMMGFAFLVIATSINGAVGQILQAEGLFFEFALANGTSLILGLMIIVPLTMTIGIYGLVVASLVQAFIQFAMFALFLQRSFARRFAL